MAWYKAGVTQWDEFWICALASQGFYATTVQKIIKSYTGEEFALSTIYRVAAANDVRFTDYRKGEGQEAQDALQRISLRAAETTPSKSELAEKGNSKLTLKQAAEAKEQALLDEPKRKGKVSVVKLKVHRRKTA